MLTCGYIDDIKLLSNFQFVFERGANAMPAGRGLCGHTYVAHTLRPRQNGRHFADDIFKCIFLNENVWIWIKISLMFVHKGPINKIPALVQIMAWRRPGDKPLSEPMLISLPTHICVTRPQWVNNGAAWCCTVCNFSIRWWTMKDSIHRIKSWGDECMKESVTCTFILTFPDFRYIAQLLFRSWTYFIYTGLQVEFGI